MLINVVASISDTASMEDFFPDLLGGELASC
jgi:hypothetical protein